MFNKLIAAFYASSSECKKADVLYCTVNGPDTLIRLYLPITISEVSAAQLLIAAYYANHQLGTKYLLCRK